MNSISQEDLCLLNSNLENDEAWNRLKSSTSYEHDELGNSRNGHQFSKNLKITNYDCKLNCIENQSQPNDANHDTNIIDRSNITKVKLITINNIDANIKKAITSHELISNDIKVMKDHCILMLANLTPTNWTLSFTFPSEKHKMKLFFTSPIMELECDIFRPNRIFEHSASVKIYKLINIILFYDIEFPEISFTNEDMKLKEVEFQMINISENKIYYKCNICEYTTGNRCHFTRHYEGVHLKIKKYKCDYCPYAATLKGTINRHMKNTHRGNSKSYPQTKNNV